LLPSLFAQTTSLNLGAQLTLTNSYYAAGLGSEIAFSGDTVVAEGNSSDAPGYRLPVYIFQKAPGGWANETQTAELTPSDAADFSGGGVAIDGNTVIVGSDSKVYIFEKPAAGWKNMTEIAQLTTPYSGSHLAIVGDTIVVGGSQSAYVFVKPAGGWVTTSTYTAQLSPPSTHSTLENLAFSGDTFAMIFGEGIYVFQKPPGGWATSDKPAALLTNSLYKSGGGYGYSLAIGGDTIAAGAPGTQEPNGQIGAVDLFVKPAAGWRNMTETAELYSPYTKDPGEDLGFSVAIDSEHLVVSTERSDEFYVYSKPAAGWKSGAWPSQVYVGQSPNAGYGVAYGFGDQVALDGDTVVTAASAAEINGVVGAGDIYVFPLQPNSIEISSDLLEYPEMSFGATGEVLPLTITNSSASTLNFTTWISSGNYQILKTAENTCNGGVVPAGQSCTLPVQFDPPAVGKHTNYLTLSSPSTASFRIVELQGLADGLGANSETPMNFLTNVGTPQTLPLVLRNFGVPGLPTVSVSFPNGAFSLVPGGSCTTTGVPQGQTCTLMIQFNPTTGGNYSGKIALKPSSGATSFVTVQAYAQYPEGGD
jgi:hypothetical protein